jgi:hypothetical protein
VTAQRLRHTFASQMLTAGMPVPSLQPNQHTLPQLVEGLKTPGLEKARHDEILDIILANIS